MTVLEFYLRRNSKKNMIPVVLGFNDDVAASDGRGATGETISTVTANYQKNTGSAHAAITLVAGTLGTWVSSGFKEADATNLPGVYWLSLPDVVLQGNENLTEVSLFLGSSNANVEDTVVFIHVVHAVDCGCG